VGLPTRIQNLIDEGVVLGWSVIEDYSRTNRLRALVGIQLLAGKYRSSSATRYVDELLSQPQIERHIVGLYRTRGGSDFDIVIDLTASTTRQLDETTDLLSDINADGIPIETSTFILAKSKHRIPVLIRPEDREIVDLPADRQRLSAEILSLEEAFLVGLGDEIEASYHDLGAEERLGLAMLWSTARSLIDLEGMGGVSAKYALRIGDAVREMTKGYLANDALEVEKGLLLMVPVVDPLLQLAVLRIVGKLFDHPKEAQSSLSLGTTRFDRYTLGNSVEFFQKVSDKLPRGEFGVLPASDVLKLQRWNSCRNDLIHGSPENERSLVLGLEEMRDLFTAISRVLRRVVTEIVIPAGGLEADEPTTSS
jgi:DNA-binding Lrp family transcriptional regulator